MRRQAIYGVAGLILVIASAASVIWKHRWREVSIDGAENFITITWKSSGGARVDEIQISYSSSEEARKGFADLLKRPGRIIQLTQSPAYPLDAEQGPLKYMAVLNPQRVQPN
jgi:hypothetical protein